MNKDFAKDFNQCPACGSKERFFEQLAQELKDRGIAKAQFNFSYDLKKGVVIDQTTVARIPIGSELPGYEFQTDICMECGCIYATRLRRIQAKRTLEPPQKPMPQQKPHIMGLPMNNPRFS